MEPYEQSELGGVGEGPGAIDRADPLTQLRHRQQAAKSSQPSPRGRGATESTILKSIQLRNSGVDQRRFGFAVTALCN
jgi:hypothetical protein